MKIGEIGWIDLTVAEAEEIRDFYARVAGWNYEPVSMGEYADFTMQAEDGAAVGGICHARGSNAGLPAQWLIYINVADLDASARACVEGGGTLLVEPKSMGAHGRYCVIRDPAGAVAALWQKTD